MVRILIEQQCDSFARRELALLMLALDLVRPAAETKSRLELVELVSKLAQAFPGFDVCDLHDLRDGLMVWGRGCQIVLSSLFTFAVAGMPSMITTREPRISNTPRPRESFHSCRRSPFVETLAGVDAASGKRFIVRCQ